VKHKNIFLDLSRPKMSNKRQRKGCSIANKVKEQPKDDDNIVSSSPGSKVTTDVDISPATVTTTTSTSVSSGEIAPPPSASSDTTAISTLSPLPLSPANEVESEKQIDKKRMTYLTTTDEVVKVLKVKGKKRKPECIICKESTNYYMKCCNVGCCQECLYRWLDKHDSCPHCRKTQTINRPDLKLSKLKSTTEALLHNYLAIKQELERTVTEYVTLQFNLPPDENGTFIIEFQ